MTTQPIKSIEVQEPQRRTFLRHALLSAVTLVALGLLLVLLVRPLDRTSGPASGAPGGGQEGATVSHANSAAVVEKGGLAELHDDLARSAAPATEPYSEEADTLGGLAELYGEQERSRSTAPHTIFIVGTQEHARVLAEFLIAAGADDQTGRQAPVIAVVQTDEEVAQAAHHFDEPPVQLVDLRR